MYTITLTPEQEAALEWLCAERDKVKGEDYAPMTKEEMLQSLVDVRMNFAVMQVTTP